MTDIADKIANKIVELQAQEAEIAEAISNYKAKLADVVGEGERVTEDGIKVIVYRHKAFNEAYGKKKNPELWQRLAENKPVLDSATFKRAIAEERATEDEYAEFQKASDGLSVKLEVANDD